MAQQNRSIGTILRINFGISKFSFRTWFFPQFPDVLLYFTMNFPDASAETQRLDLSGLPRLRNGFQLPKCFALLATQIDTVASWEATVTLGNVTATVGRNWEFEDGGWVNWCWMVGGDFNSWPFFWGLEGYWEIGGASLFRAASGVCLCLCSEVLQRLVEMDESHCILQNNCGDD